jgi:hypothetical protein
MEDKEIIELIDEKTKSKLESRTFWTLFTVGFAILSIIFGAIGNLYVIYFSGISELKVEMASISANVENIKEDIKPIKALFTNYDVKID